MKIYHLFFFSMILICVEYYIRRKKNLPAPLWKENFVTIALFGFSLYTGYKHWYFPLELKYFFDFIKPSLVIPQVAGLSFPGPRWFQLIILFLFVDLTYYSAHRLGHKVNLFWSSHFTHHTITRLDILSAHRDPIRFLNFNLLFPWFPVHAQFSPEFAALSYTYFLYVGIHSTWLHCSLIPKVRYLEYIFNTPSSHRVHHSLSNRDRTLAVNFGGVLIIWDRLFGTYVEEKVAVHQFGIAGFTKSDHILYVIFHQWVQFLKQLVACRSFREIFETIFWPLPVENLATLKPQSDSQIKRFFEKIRMDRANADS